MIRLGKPASWLVGVAMLLAGVRLSAQIAPVRESGDSISIRIINTDLRSAVQALGQWKSVV